ncbi:MAG: hypothetical protein E7586_03355 [Ruminococcaceae bacterium]|nr:hypothetical protein [Oscillospiraceae bacterium]
MKHKKIAYISIMLCAVLLILSVSPIASAEVQLAYSKISDDLMAVYNQRSSSEKTDVIVWLNDTATEEYQKAVPKTSSSLTKEGSIVNLDDIINSNLSSTKVSLEERLERIEEKQAEIMENRRIAREIYLEHNTAVAEKLSKCGEVTYISEYSPILICSLTKSEALNVARNDKVSSLVRGDIEMEDCASLAYTNTNIGFPYLLGYGGQGIKLGMLETGRPDLNNSVLAALSEKITFQSSSAEVKPHATAVASIMVDPNYGFAKGFEHLYSASCDTYGNMVLRIEWLLTQGVNVINMSSGDENSSNRYWSYAKWIDHIAYNHSVHIVIASGNHGRNKVALPAMAYNAITVGAVDDQNTASYSDDMQWYYVQSSSFSDDTVPRSAYNTNEDRPYKPDICSYGGNILIPSISTNPEEAFNGTSFAAPQIAGMVATLCSLEPELLTAMDLTKAILTCSVLQKTENTQHNYNTDDTGYHQYGAGIANASNATYLINGGTYVSGTITSTEDTDIIPLGALQKGQKVTVSMNFLKRTMFSSAGHGNFAPDVDTPLPDLDIYIVPRIQMGIATFDKSLYVDPNDYTYIYRSISVNNNLEKVTFVPESNIEYYLVIKKLKKQNSVDYHDILYGAAWIKHTSNIK